MLLPQGTAKACPSAPALPAAGRLTLRHDLHPAALGDRQAVGIRRRALAADKRHQGEAAVALHAVAAQVLQQIEGHSAFVVGVGAKRGGRA